MHLNFAELVLTLGDRGRGAADAARRFAAGEAAVADLSADPLARQLLRAWSRKPWPEPRSGGNPHQAALADLLDERGLPVEAEETRGLRPFESALRAPALPRRGRGRILRRWRDFLAACYGDFTNTLPCEAPADTGDIPF